MISFDIFCRVIDNYGDAAVSLRLAKSLAERGHTVRLWCDQQTLLQRLASELPLTLSLHDWFTNDEDWQNFFRHSTSNTLITSFSSITPVTSLPIHVVIEAFGCQLPASVEQQIAYRNSIATQCHSNEPPTNLCVSKIVWINLEYLATESWADQCHGLAGRQPQLAVDKYFYFPGFSPQTGGLLRDAAACLSRDVHVREDQPIDLISSFLSSSAWSATPYLIDAIFSGWHDYFKISWLVYDLPHYYPLYVELLRIYANPQQNDQAIMLFVPLNHKFFSGLAEFCRRTAPPVFPEFLLASLLQGIPVRHHNLTIIPYPFVPQQSYELLLGICQLNFVRGEDSFVQAHWAQAPLVWQPYQQQERAELDKLAGYLQQAAYPPQVKQFWHSWNAVPSAPALAEAWHAYRQNWPSVVQAHLNWRAQLANQQELAAGIVQFIDKVL